MPKGQHRLPERCLRQFESREVGDTETGFDRLHPAISAERLSLSAT
jgi:hypothetical protein